VFVYKLGGADPWGWQDSVLHRVPLRMHQHSAKSLALETAEEQLAKQGTS